MTRRGPVPARLLDRTAAEWAEALGVTRRTAERWIAGTVTPDLATAATIADIAGVPLDRVAAELLQRQAEPDPTAET